MHEQSLMNDLLKKISQIAKAEEANKVLKVKVELGALAHISPDHFREHFEHDLKGTIAEGAELEIIQNNDIHHPRAQDITLLSIDV